MILRRSQKQVRNKRSVKADLSPPKASAPNGRDWGRGRLWCVGVIFTALWFALLGRAYQLQIIQGPELAERARRQFTAREVLHGMRGNILDRNGNILARSMDSQSVSVNPALVVNQRATAEALSRILELPLPKVSSLLMSERKFVWIKRKISPKAAAQIKDAALPGVNLEGEFDRLYPYEHLAGQLIGFVDVDDKGLEGLEKSFDSRLTGQRVRQVMQRDAAGRRLTLPGSEDSGDLRGQDLRLTIDTQVQFFAEEALAENVEKFGAKWGGCIVVDVASGDILAWAQFPFFNPNRYKDYSPAVRRNRLAMDALEQGSTIKSFLIAAALEEKVVAPSTIINCEKGKWVLRTATIHDTHAYSNLTVDKVLHVSSNIGAAKIGMKLGAAKYFNYLTRLGFGTRPELRLAGEARGILRPAQQWQEIDLAAASFGQSFSATLAQMAQAYLTLAGSGNKKTLNLYVSDLTGDDPQEGASVATSEAVTELAKQGGQPVIPGGPNDRIFSAATLRLVRSMMREVVEEEGGTGSQARIPGVEVGGKTGTAQKADRTGKYGAGRVGSFVGMVPIDNPRYLICVLLDEPSKNIYGGVVAAPVFRYVALRTLAYHGILPDNDDSLAKNAAPKEASRQEKSVRGKEKTPRGKEKPPTRSALAEASRQQTRQPAAFQTAPIAPRKAVPPNTVPSVVGMGVRQAVEEFVKQGVMPVLKGKGGFVVRQVPEPGTAWPHEKSTTLWLEERVL